MNNKKSITSFEFLMWIPKIIFLVIVMFAIMVLIRSYVITTINISELTANVFLYRILYSPTGVSYIDDSIQRVYPGVIDIDKFNSLATTKSLEKSIYYGEKNKDVGAKFLLRDLIQSSEMTNFYNEDFYKEQKKIVDSGFTEGPGGARGYTKKYNVLILKNNALNKGILIIDIVIPNS